MGNFIKTVGEGGPDKTPSVKRAVGLLSDGSAVALVVDSNQPGVTGDGGDGTNVPKLYLYHSTDRINWTLKASITSNSGVQAEEVVASMVVDSANNVHIVFGNANTKAVRYVMCTYSSVGPSWSAGAQVNLVPPADAPASMPTRIDIDTMGGSTNCLVVGAWYFSATAPKSAVMVAWVRTTTGSWVTQTSTGIITLDSQLPYTDDLSISGDTTPIGADNVAIYAWVATAKPATTGGLDKGDALWVVRVNASTGARIQSVSVRSAFLRNLNNGFRVHYLFATGQGEWVLASHVGAAPWKVSIHKFRWNRGTGKYEEIVPFSLSGNLANITRNPYTNNWGSVAYAGNGKVFFFATTTDGYLVAHIASISGGTVKFQAGQQFFDDAYKWGLGSGHVLNGVPPDITFSGATRNWNPARIDVLAFYYKVSIVAYTMESISKLSPNLPASVKPAAGTTSTTDRPTLSGQHRLQKKFAQARVKMEWQIASDAGFTTNARVIQELDTDYVLANYTNDTIPAIVTATEAIPGVSELFQGTWYVRARSLDEAGAYGPYSAAQSFVVSHPPSATNLYPTAGAVFIYGGSGNVTFTWKFTDPSGSDTQTAYQIVVEDADQQTVLLDGGKVTSSLASATLAIPPAGKDLNLRWKLRVWDSDDVSGAYSDYQLFYVADPPAPVISSPADASVVTTAVPIVTWSEGLGGVREQVSYRLRVSQGTSLIYTSDWVNSTATAHQVPIGYLKNSQQYTFTIDVRDNLALEGTSFVAVSTSWIPPDGPASPPLAYIHEYDRRGFVYLTWSNQGRDPDFVAWVVYRRQRGQSSWTQIGQYSSGSDRYAHRDYLAGTDQTYEYTVTQVVQRFGDILESIIDDVAVATPKSERYWLINPSDMSFALPLLGVNGDKYSEQYESESYHVIGRGMRVEYGDRLGYVGSLSLNMRDRQLFASPSKNYARNPTLSIASTELSNPDGWSISSSGNVGDVSGEFVDTINPSPVGLTPFRLRADAMAVAVTDKITLSQRIEGIDFPGEFKLPGTKVTISGWIGNSENNISKNYRIDVKWLNAGGGTISQVNSGALKPSIHGTDAWIKSYDEDGKAGLPVGRWKRLSFICFVPSTSPSGIEVSFSLEGDPTGTGSAPAELMITAVQIQPGNLTDYFDGNSVGGSWMGDTGLSASETNGFYTARQQRQALMNIKALKSGLYLRNPFGDVWYVAPGDISVDRVSGVGKAEFVNAEMPYQEVDF